MKSLPAISAIAILGLTACDTMNGPLTGGDFDPLRPPGSATISTAAGPSYNPGQFVIAAMDNTAFFRNRPKGDAQADRLLNRGTSMKVVSTTGGNVKVELDSGDIGWVPSVMLEDPNNAVAPATLPPGQYQVYPPLPSSGLTGQIEPLPLIDPASMPPEGAIPTVIDPAAPADSGALPPVDVTPPNIPTPPPTIEPNLESVPLPPNGEELGQ